MDLKTQRSPQVTSETCEAKQTRLEQNAQNSPYVLIKRDCLNSWLEEAYGEYSKSFSQGDKASSLVWDGFIRAFHRCLDAEVATR